MSFNLIQDGDFGSSSARPGLCYVTGERKQPGDRGIFRGPTIEWEGFLDVSQRCITNAAESIGWISPDKYEHLVEEIKRMTNEILELQSEVETRNEALRAMHAINLGEEGTRNTVCPICGFVAKTEAALKMHMTKMH